MYQTWIRWDIQIQTTNKANTTILRRCTNPPPPPAGGPLARCQLPKNVKNARLMLEPAVVFQTRFHLNLLGRIVWRRLSMKYVIMNIDIYVV